MQHSKTSDIFWFVWNSQIVSLVFVISAYYAVPSHFIFLIYTLLTRISLASMVEDHSGANLHVAVILIDWMMSGDNIHLVEMSPPFLRVKWFVLLRLNRYFCVQLSNDLFLFLLFLSKFSFSLSLLLETINIHKSFFIQQEMGISCDHSIQQGYIYI